MACTTTADFILPCLFVFLVALVFHLNHVCEQKHAAVCACVCTCMCVCVCVCVCVCAMWTPGMKLQSSGCKHLSLLSDLASRFLCLFLGRTLLGIPNSWNPHCIDKQPGACLDSLASFTSIVLEQQMCTSTSPMALFFLNIWEPRFYKLTC